MVLDFSASAEAEKGFRAEGPSLLSATVSMETYKVQNIVKYTFQPHFLSCKGLLGLVKQLALTSRAFLRPSESCNGQSINKNDCHFALMLF